METGNISRRNLQVAQGLAAAGYPVFPCAWPAKSPVTKNGFRDATTDPKVIKTWWRKNPRAVPGLPTGERTGLAVIDLDRKKGKDGFAALRAMGIDPDSLSPCEVATPTGGKHAYFLWREGLGNSAKHLPPGVDLRGEGGYVIAPGAVTPDGTYEPLGDDLAAPLIGLTDFPDWAMPPPREKREVAPPPDVPFSTVRAALMAIPNDGASANTKSRDWWRDLLATVHHATGGSEEGRDLAHEWSRQWPGYKAADTDKLWRSFKPDHPRARTVASLSAEARRHGWRDLSAFDALEAEETLDEAIARLIGDPADAGRAVVTVAALDGVPIMRGDRPVVNLTNAALMLARNLDSILPDLHLNEMNWLPHWRGGEVKDAHILDVRMNLERRGLETISTPLVAEAMQTVAEKRTHHPVRHYLRGLHHDGGGRLDDWLIRLAGADDTPFNRAAGRKFLISMVARVMRPGCKVDHMLVLVGGQGAGKSSVCRVLAGGDTYFSDSFPFGAKKQEAEKHLRGKWLIEWSELAGLRKGEVEEAKSIISRQVDSYRRAYARFDSPNPRQCVFIGTTNDEEFLQDWTGGRRFWPVHVADIDLDGLTAERDQLFAEAVAAFDAGEPWWMNREFERIHAKPLQDAATEADPWEEPIREWLAGQLDFDGKRKVQDQVTMSDVLRHALNLPESLHTAPNARRAARVMKGLGWAKVKSHGNMVWRKAKV